MGESRVDALNGLLELLDLALAGAEPKELAALSREKRQVLGELASLGGVRKGSTVDELGKRRADRRSAAAVGAQPVKRRQQRGKRSG